MKLGTVMGVGDMPYYVYTDPDGDQIALPCTERLYTERQAVQVATYRVMPLLSPARAAGAAARRVSPRWPARRWPASGRRSTPPAAGRRPPPAPRAPEPPAAEAGGGGAGPASRTGRGSHGRRPARDQPPRPRRPRSGDELDLDALLASLNAPAEPPAEDATEPDLDALLASLK